MRYILAVVSLEHRYLDIISGRSRTPLASLSRAMLSAAEIPYRGLMIMRNSRYDGGASRAHRLGRPTISVGNITAGGTGKTPVVQWLASRLQQVGQRPAVLMRGYRKAGATLSDEQVMLQQLLPDVIIEANPDRIAGAAAVIAGHPETSCFILDDGFQHRRARRDFDLVLIHAAQPFGFGHTHPRGLLREPLQGLSRASTVLLTHASEIPPEVLLKTQNEIRRHCAAPIFHCDHVNSEIVSADDTNTRELSDLATMPFILVTGIGQPEQLVASLQRFPTSFKGELRFPDHHGYGAADLTRIAAACTDRGAQTVVTTEKDWTKLGPLWLAKPEMPRAYRLRLNIRFWEDEEKPLLSLITAKLNQM